MGIGGSIALLVIGAILAFAVKNTDLGGWLDINDRNTVPEPGTLLALGAGVGVLARRRRAKKA